MIKDVLAWIGFSDVAIVALLLFMLAFALVLLSLAMTPEKESRRQSRLPLEDQKTDNQKECRR